MKEGHGETDVCLMSFCYAKNWLLRARKSSGDGHLESLVRPRRERSTAIFHWWADKGMAMSCSSGHWNKFLQTLGEKRNQILKSRCGRETFHANEERKEPASWPLFLGLLAPGSLLRPMVWVVFPMSFHLCFTCVYLRSPDPPVPLQNIPVLIIGSTQKSSFISVCKVLYASKETVRVDPRTRKRTSSRAIMMSTTGTCQWILLTDLSASVLSDWVHCAQVQVITTLLWKSPVGHVSLGASLTWLIINTEQIPIFSKVHVNS